jgi:hypothetical protein
MRAAIIAFAALAISTTAAQAQALSVLTFQPNFRDGGFIFRIETSGNNLQQCNGLVAMLNHNFPAGSGPSVLLGMT